MEFLVLYLVCRAIFSLFGGWIAVQKNREVEEGLIIGFFFGPLGCLVEAVLPSREKPTRPLRKLSDLLATGVPPTPEEAARTEAARADEQARLEDARRR